LSFRGDVTTCKRILADVFTPVGIYLRLRDRFRDTILLESTDHHAAENSYSFICVNAIGGIEITDKNRIEFKLPGQKPEKIELKNSGEVPQLLWDFTNKFEPVISEQKEIAFAQGLFGYTTYDAVQFFDAVKLTTHDSELTTIPLIRYRLYQYVIAFNHHKDELLILENKFAGLDSEFPFILSK